MPQKSVLIMLAAFNGEKYIIEQVQSILDQRDVCVHVVIRDDCSSDATVDLVSHYFADEERVELIKGTENLGCTASFMQMLLDANEAYDYYALSDQDDYWLPNKLDRAISMIEREGNLFDSILYCCNRDEVDADGTFLYQNVPLKDADHAASFEYFLFVRNAAPGNTMVFTNGFLNEIKSIGAVEIPPSLFHDNWLHLVAIASNRTKVIYDFDYSGVRRRLTGHNLAGVNRIERQRIGSLIKRFTAHYPRARQIMVRQLLENYDRYIDDRHRGLLVTFSTANRLRSRIQLLKYAQKVKYDSVKGRAFNVYKIVLGII